MTETGEQIGTARIDIIADTASFDAEVKRSKNIISTLGPEGEKNFQKLTQAQKRATIAALRFEQSIGKSREEVRTLSFAAKGALPEALERVRQKLLQTRTAADSANVAMGTQAKAFGGSTKSAREMQFAMRTLPAQFTDIATAIGSGQRPLTILLQQGGQIKDMFGGIRPALAAVGSQLLKLVNPYTAVAVAAGALLFAWKQGIDEIEAYNAALIKTGNFSGLTAKQLDDMAASMDSVRGTQHAAAAAFAQTVQTGVFTGDQIQLVASALETAGKNADKMVQSFAKIADDPVNALIELNKHEHFLTAATLDQVRALEKQGRAQDAATLAIKIRSDTVISRADEMKAHLDNVSQAWGGVKSAAAEAWDAMIHGTRDTANGVIQEIKDLWSGLQDAAGFIRNPRGTVMNAVYAPGATATATNNADRDAARKALAQQANETLISLQQQTDKFKTAEKKRAEQIIKIIGESNAAIDKANAAGDKALASKIARQEEALIAAIQKQDKGAANKSGGRGSKASTFDSDRYRQKALDDIQKEIQAEGKLADARARAAAADVAFKAQLDQQLQTRKAAIDLQVKSIGMGQKEFSEYSQVNRVYQEFDRQLARLNRERDAGSISIDQYNKRLAELRQSEADTVEAVTNGFKAADLARSNAMNGMTAAIADFIDQQRDLAEQTRQFTTNFIGGFGDAFASFVSGTESAKDAFGSFIDSMYQQALKFLANQAIQKLLQLGQTGPSGLNAGFFGMFNEGAAENTATGIIGSILGDGRAAGGPVRAGGLYPVVEDGPELLSVGSRSYLMMGAQSGTVTPNSQIRNVGSNKPQQIINVNVQPTNTRRTAEQVANAVARKQRIATARNG